MSVVCAVRKGGVVAICADTQTNSGSLVSSAKHVVNSRKLFSVNGSAIGVVGWTVVAEMLEHAIVDDRSLFKLNGRSEIFQTVMRLHEKMKDIYKIETKEDDDQPAESIQLHAMVANTSGIFEISSYRSVTEYSTYFAIGSGARLALGAMHALYSRSLTAKKIVEAGVLAAAEFEDGCGLPFTTRTFRLAR
jgi:ATP-dependent HslUV protease subunit HslV